MFGLIGSLASAAVRTVATPVAVVADVATLGGSLTGRSETYTGKNIRKIGDDLGDAKDEVENALG